MTIQEIMARQWGVNQLTIMGPINKMTEETARYRLTPDTASAGFIALHAGEAMHRFAKLLFNYDAGLVAQAMGGVADDGRVLDLDKVRQTLEQGFSLIAEHIQLTPDEQWTEVISTSFGELPRMGVLQFLMHHNSYHCGQIAQAIKKGKVYEPTGAAQ